METTFLTWEDFVRAKEALEKAQVPEPYYLFIIDEYLDIETNGIYEIEVKFSMITSYNDFFPFAQLPPASTPYCETQCAAVPAKKAGFCKSKIQKEEKEVENTMTVNNSERDYLNRRLREVQAAFRSDFSTKFRIYNDNMPRSYKELIDAIKNDQFKLDDKRTKKVDAYIETEGRFYGGPFDGIIWNLPNAPDLEGYELAIKALSKAYQDAQDVINTSDSKDGLAALKAFEAWTYEAPAKAA